MGYRRGCYHADCEWRMKSKTSWQSEQFGYSLDGVKNLCRMHV
jgi:hypothetical protein